MRRSVCLRSDGRKKQARIDLLEQLGIDRAEVDELLEREKTRSAPARPSTVVSMDEKRRPSRPRASSRQTSASSDAPPRYSEVARPTSSRQNSTSKK